MTDSNNTTATEARTKEVLEAQKKEKAADIASTIEAMDADSDVSINRVLNNMDGMDDVQEYQRIFVDTVLRPYIKALNYTQAHEVAPGKVMDAVSALCSNLVCEMVLRIVPRSNHEAAEEVSNQIMGTLAYYLSIDLSNSMEPMKQKKPRVVIS